MSLVSAVCETTAVLDFGKLIASGPTAQVLRDEHVMRAYLGTAEVSTMCQLELRDITVERGGRPVVKDVTITGSRRARSPPLLGPNGAGKSSLVLAVGGVLQAAARVGVARRHRAGGPAAGEDPRRRGGDRARGPAAAARPVRRRQHQGRHLRADQAGRRRGPRPRARAVPAARRAAHRRRPGCCPAASSRWSCSPRRWSRSRSTS